MLYLGTSRMQADTLAVICLLCIKSSLEGAARAQGVAMALLVLATWLLMWFSDVCGAGLLSAHYTHFRLRLRSQAGLLLQRRRTWLVVSAIVALDSFGISLTTSYVFQMPNVRPAFFRFRVRFNISAIVALDSSGISLTTSYVYQMPNVRPACHHTQI